MIYEVRHRTTYRYQQEVAYARCVLRLTPFASAEQTVLESRIELIPHPARQERQTGPFGEQITRVLIDRPHAKLVIDSRSRVDVHSLRLPLTALAEPWEAVRQAALQSRTLDPASPALYLYPTRRTPISPAITDYARRSFSPNRSIIDAASELMARLRADFAYDPEATSVHTPAIEAFERRRGVCQDFAHIMICGLRGLGLPARYVSGYIRTIPAPGQPRLEGADATHAWVSVWCGADQGWIGFDPTNNTFAETDHIVLAMGRDYLDVAPIDGVLLGPGRQTLTVEVDVLPEKTAQRLAAG